MSIYMENVYHFERGLNKPSHGRVNPTYNTGQVIMPVFFGFLLRIKSFNERVEWMLHRYHQQKHRHFGPMGSPQRAGQSFSNS